MRHDQHIHVKAPRLLGSLAFFVVACPAMILIPHLARLLPLSAGWVAVVAAAGVIAALLRAVGLRAAVDPSFAAVVRRPRPVSTEARDETPVASPPVVAGLQPPERGGEPSLSAGSAQALSEPADVALVARAHAAPVAR